ncbi:MAG: carbon-nitrogen hydrolase family protein [Candidatus Krumholzibacteria bacterium]|nr:carbon-nitrogen hydrolase family protein [Candidatus Krumholzibacteria bacterium]MDH4337948.1 carbon-nitrogen hydrolase family protein [Candidatus Krumholzibacteria bacterium]MDH5270306.1 carbon-nitrogen hydrolase family protein [Candidatus Krumholzibacteria bacterium]MDH5627676.1 carbon-nitrogen hydrolase family protein [Candidatus Krumholzibacteria bacterium]
MEKELDRIRVATLQYFIRPISSFDQFRNQVAGLVETAADYKCHLLVFPEYFTLQLLTLEDIRRPIHELVRSLALQRERFVELMSGLARKHRVYIAAGTIPSNGTEDGVIHNEGFFFGPSGGHTSQCKIHMTRFEKEEWFVEPLNELRIIETNFGRVALNVCYDVEFPELARVAAREGVSVLIVPSCTDDRQGFLRVRYCAQARAIENQMYVVHSSTVGSLPMVPAVSLNYGQASILTPSDFPFSRDGILAEGLPNQETMVIGELNLRILMESRESGTVLPLRDSVASAEVKKVVEVVKVT